MTPKRRRMLRILGVVALLFVAAGQVMHAAEQLLVPAAATECGHHSEAAPRECPADHSCCHAHGSSLVLPVENSSVLVTASRSLRFFVCEKFFPEGSLREIDHPPQLS
jgi:hypothetical protein